MHTGHTLNIEQFGTGIIIKIFLLILLNSTITILCISISIFYIFNSDGTKQSLLATV